MAAQCSALPTEGGTLNRRLVNGCQRRSRTKVCLSTLVSSLAIWPWTNHRTNNLLIAIIRAGELIFFHPKDGYMILSISFWFLTVFISLLILPFCSCMLSTFFFFFAIRDLSILIIVDLNLQSNNFNIFTVPELHSDTYSVSSNCVLYLLIIFGGSEELGKRNPFLFPVLAPAGYDSLSVSLNLDAVVFPVT